MLGSKYQELRITPGCLRCCLLQSLPITCVHVGFVVVCSRWALWSLERDQVLNIAGNHVAEVWDGNFLGDSLVSTWQWIQIGPLLLFSVITPLALQVLDITPRHQQVAGCGFWASPKECSFLFCSLCPCLHQHVFCWISGLPKARECAIFAKSVTSRLVHPWAKGWVKRALANSLGELAWFLAIAKGLTYGWVVCTLSWFSKTGFCTCAVVIDQTDFGLDNFLGLQP